MKKLKKQFLAAVLTAVMAVCAFAGTTPVAAATLSQAVHQQNGESHRKLEIL